MPLALVRERFSEGDVQKFIDQAIVELENMTTSSIQSTVEDCEKAMERQCESRKKKHDRLDKHKRTYAAQIEENDAAKKRRVTDRRE